MNCPHCQAPLLRFPVTDEWRPHLPEDSPGAAICPTCLVLEPDPDPPSTTPDFGEIGDPFPGGEAAVPMAIAIGLLDSLALNRSEIAELFAAVEEAGTDPLLVLDRLATTGSVDSRVDLQGRRQQLEQLLE
jgi:hypothetical protein